MVRIPSSICGPWSNVGYLLLAHVVAGSSVYDSISMEWVAERLSVSVGQVRRMLHRENVDSDSWLPDMLCRLREQGYPEMIVFEQHGVMHYTTAKPLDYEMEVVFARTPIRYITRNSR